MKKNILKKHKEVKSIHKKNSERYIIVLIVLLVLFFLLSISALLFALSI